MEKNKKRVFTGTVAMLVILFGLLLNIIPRKEELLHRKFL